jgi:hypothetical protein
MVNKKKRKYFLEKVFRRGKLCLSALLSLAAGEILAR